MTESALSHALIEQVRADLSRAGFVVDPAAVAVDGGVHVAHDARRGVVVSWATTAQMTTSDLAGHHHVRAAVHLALLTILTGAGYTVASDPASGEVIVTGLPA
ncbi:hypothetical protein ACFFMN_41720 [Planobispora siamensis]|uniref:Uncharacterized protein n=1 Tax=Planobispora siamensis TaxID=936338 RepID=A0A8J3WND1_9ACTN|nr:hypothetical protein [Planobispora siamensis]GIH95913.1 hypothetical protein Psi01_65430 [Planobispora siamensis]